MRGFACFGIVFLLWAGSTAAQVEERVEETSIVAEIKRELEARKRGLSPFGYKLFETASFQPDTLYGPVSPDYLVGPGDEVIVNVWGQVEFSYTTVVNRDGFINIPKVGLISVNGLTLKKLQDKIVDYLSRAYSGISRDPTKATTFVDVSLGKLKPIRVFVIGEVKSPGTYLLSAASTALNALYRAGGPLPSGSLRQIRVIRRGKVIATLDLYDYLLKGRIKDVKLQTDDTILVPPIGRRVWLAGRVHRPAVYELKPGEGLKELLEIAGGPEPDAYLGKVQIDRIVKHKERKVIDVDFAEALASGKKVELFDGDVVLISSVLDRRENVVKASGFVKRPGLYQWKEGMRVRDLILKAGGVWEEAFMGRADVIRTRPDLTKEIIPFNLEKALQGDESENLELQKLDEVVVHSIHTFREKEYVTIEGWVKRPGRYELLENMTLKDLIVQAGGLKETAYKLRAEISRVDPEAVGPGRPAEIIFVDIGDDYSKDTDWGNFKLRNFDTVFIRPNPNWQEPSNVVVLGEVMFPGTYTLQRPDERLSDIIARAGGLKETAYPEGVIFLRRRVDVDAVMRDIIEQMYCYRLAFLRSEEGQKHPSHKLIEAYLDSVLAFGREKGAYLDTLLALLRDEDDIKTLMSRLEEKSCLDSLISILVEPGGRMERIAVDLKDAIEHPGSDVDLTLCDGDWIIVPRKPKTVVVSGEVLFPSAVPYVEGKGVGYYLTRAGGLRETADKHRIRIILPNGRVESPRRFWFDPEILPGSTIFVPRIESPKPQWRGALGDALKFISAAAVAVVIVDRVIR